MRKRNCTNNDPRNTAIERKGIPGRKRKNLGGGNTEGRGEGLLVGRNMQGTGHNREEGRGEEWGEAKDERKETQKENKKPTRNV